MRRAFHASLLAVLLSAGLLPGCASSSGDSDSSWLPSFIVPAKVNEAPGPTNASGMGATPTPLVPVPPISRAASEPEPEPEPPR
jgi:hypothetical protein